MKKIGSLVLVLVLILAAMAGCASGNTESSSSTASAAESQTSQAESTSEPANADLGAISVVSREDGSGTRGAFIELFGIEEKDADGNKIDNTTEEAIVTNSTTVMMTTVAGNPAAIGYISLGSLNDTVKALKIDGADATVENIKSGSYKVSRLSLIHI